MQIDIKNVEWDTQVQNPIAPAPKAIDMKSIEWDDAPKKEYGLLEKVYDVVTSNPVANFIPNKIKEWSAIDEDKKVDRETLYNIESLAKIDTRLIGDASPEQKEQYLLNISKVLDKKGYKLAEVENGDKKEYVALDAEGNQKEITNNFFNSLVDGLLADKYEIGGAIAGAAKGYDLTKAVPNAWIKAAGILGGGALGAMGGTAADTAESTIRTGQDFKVEDFFNELNKSAALDVAGAVAGASLIKVGGKLIDVPKKAWDYVAADNIDGAKKILRKITDYSDDEIEAALQQAKTQYKEVEQYTKSGMTDIAKKQEEILAVAQSDKKIGSSYIHDVVLDDKDVAEAVAKTVDKRTKNLVKSFEDVAIDGTEVKRAVEGYERQVGENYGKMRDTLKEAFANVDYAFDLKALKTDEIMRSTVDEIVNPFDKEVAQNLLMKVEKIVGNESGITRNFDNLVELRQVVNDFYSRASKSMKHDSKEAFSQLKKNIDTELYSAIDKNIPQEMKKPLKDMFDDAITEYKEMYAIKDTKLYSTLMEEGKSAEARMDALIKHTADDEMEFATLLKKLPAQEQVKIENSITKAILDKNLFGATNEIQVINYSKAAATLGKLEDFMVTPSGKESARIIKDMAEKFGDDFELLRAATQAGVNTNAGIATTIIGRLEYKLAKNAFDRIMRLIPFSDTSKRLALQKHLSEALKKSRTPMDMAKRVASSADVPKSDKADLLDWARDFNRANSVKNEQEAQKLLAEVEAKEALRAAKEAEAKAIMEDFANVDKAEIAAVQRLSGSSFSWDDMRRLQNSGGANIEDVQKFIDAKSKIDPKKLDNTLTDMKYPLKEAEAKLVKLLDSDKEVVGTLADEITLKTIMYDIKQGKLRNDNLKDTYKNLMKLYDEKTAQKTPLELMQSKEVELKQALRKAEFEESVDNIEGAATYRQNAQALEDEIEQLKSSIPNPNVELRTSKALSSQAQAAKDIADLNYHTDEDEAVKAVKDLFKKNKSEEKRFKNMSDEDMAEYERIHGGNVKPKQKSNDALYDEDGELIPFANPHIGSGLVAGSGNAVEYDEEGNIIGFDVDGFVKGFLAGAVSSKIGAAALKKHNPKLYSKILGVSKEFPNMATSNPKLLAEIYKTAPSAKGQALTFAGEKAIKADVAKLDDAIKMAEDGVKDSDIWRATGWFNGDDGKWRFEVDDSGSNVLSKTELDELAKDNPYEMIEVPLSQILKHDKLFEQYPQLKDINVNWEYSKAKGLEKPENVYHGASFNHKENLIIMGNGLSDKDIKSSILHEVQHAVQSIENFAKGGNPQNIKGISEYQEDKLRDELSAISKEQLSRKLGNEPKSIWVYDNNMVLKSDKELEDYEAEIIQELKNTKHNNYERLHGEAEARLTQKRTDVGYKNYPYDDLDVPRDELIIRDGEGVMEMSIAKDYKDAQGFYSVLEKTIDEKVGGKIDATSLSNMLEKNGVKQDEIEWSGLKELMEKNEKLTKEQIQETINENRLVVEVVEKGSLKSHTKLNEQYALGEIDYDEFTKKIKSNNSKYSQYKLGGGKDYREMLFTMPSKIDNDIKIIKADDGYYYAEKAPYDGSNVITSAKSQAGVTKALQAGSYKSSHWDEQNILVFMRVDDRTIDNKKTLFMEELQSDWHQEGRKKGYGKKIPNSPFKKNWHELGLKRMIQEAVANDYDKIAWTTGKQQAERNSLEKTVDTVVYNKEAGVIQATNGGKEVFFKMVASEEEIENIVGKQLAKKLLDKKNTTTDSVHVLQGEELKFGGEGMQAFYDEIVPNAAKKLFKKYGVKPKMEELDDVDQMVWSVEITPQMKEEVKKYGQPLYAVGGAVMANEAIKGDE